MNSMENIKSRLEAVRQEALGYDLEYAISIAKQSQEDAITALEKYRLFGQIFEKANVAIVVTDADFINGPHIIFVNEEFTKITGYSAEEAIGKTPRFLQGEKTDRKTLDELKKCLLAGEPFKGEIINYSKSGREYWLDINLVPIKDADGKITNFAAIERDISDNKAAEKQMLWAKEEAEYANKSKSEFLANMSHELRTPMNGIIGMCELMIDTSLNAEQKEMIKTLRSSSENLLGMLNDILDISKVEAGDLKLENVPFDISIATQEMMQLFTPVAADKNLYLALKIAENVPAVIQGDPGRLQQILRNLISNALKFTEVGGISINIAVSKQRGVPELYFQVKDTGIGVPEDKLEEIFQKFSQADTSITRKYGGTGLGLAITKQLLGMMGGIIGVESTVGYGSVFYFCIPIREAAKDAKPVNIIPEDEKKDTKINTGLKILAVDDHPVNRMFVDKLLKKMGIHDIDFAENGSDAIFMLQSKKYDLVFMDCQMPEMDGYTATKHILDIEGEDHTPIIAMTANAMVGDREKCIKSGMDDYISKPVKADKLRKVLEKWSGAVSTNEPEVVEEEKHDESSPVDLEHLAMYTDGNKDDERELFGIFIPQADISLKALDDNAVGGSCEEWRKAAHKFKGACANLGAHKLAELCKDAEKRFTETGDSKLEMKILIEKEYTKVKEFLESRM